MPGLRAGLRDDCSGQALLTFGFLLAIAITTIALMLNNVIYTNNQAYIGFMDQTQYGDQSIRSALACQIAGAYEDAGGDPAAFAALMDDYVDRVNNATMTRGKYIELTPLTVNPMPASGPDVTYVATKSRLSIHNQDAVKSYTIETNYTYHAIAPMPTVAPVPGPAPANTIVRIGCNRTEVPVDGISYAVIVIEATDAATNLPASYVKVDLHTDAGEFHELEGTIPISSVVTDVNGKALARLYSLVVDTMTVNASVGPAPTLASKNLSGNLYISFSDLPSVGTCSHAVVIDDPTLAHSTKTKSGTTFHTITVRVPIVVPAGSYDYQDFEATASFAGGTNLQLLSAADIDDVNVNHLSGTAGETRYITVKLNWINYPGAYSATIDVDVSAHCNAHDGAFTASRTITVNGPPPP